MTPAARAIAVSKCYGSGAAQVLALDEVDLEIVAGEFTAILGPSGSGKSTLMHLLAGLDEPTSGEVRIGDDLLAGMRDDALSDLRRERVGFVFQAFNLVPTLTVRENVRLPLTIARRSPDPHWFDLIVDSIGLGDCLDRKPHELSGGQQQRVACARAIVAKPDLVFADEPTGNLDSTASAEVLDFLRYCVDEFSQTVVIVTHEPLAASYADRALFLRDGKIAEDTPRTGVDDLLATLARLYPRKKAKSRPDEVSQAQAEWVTQTGFGRPLYDPDSAPRRGDDTGEIEAVVVAEPDDKGDDSTPRRAV